MNPVLERLFQLREESYAAFQQKLVPTLPKEKIIGVRVPVLRQLAKETPLEFLNTLPHDYYEEAMLHGLMICRMKDYEDCIRAVEQFLPYIDNWAVCDVLSPKVFRKHRGELIERIRVWSASELEYTCRFGLGMLMGHYLDEDFRAEYLEIPACVNSDAYYVKMMVAWFYATALAKQWDSTVPYLERRRLDPWIHNKTIQKARESYRISGAQKDYLKTLKV